MNMGQEKKDSKTDQRFTTEAEAQIYVYNKGVKYWKELSAFVEKNRITLLPIEASILRVATSGKIVSAKQAPYLIRAEKKATNLGFK